MLRSVNLCRLVDGVADARTLAVSRVLASLAAIVQAAASWSAAHRVLAPGALNAPYQIEIPSLPGRALPVFFALWVGTAIAFALGWRTRWSGSILALVVAYDLALDQQTYSNHVYLLVTVLALLVLADCGAWGSLDARRVGARPEVPAWPVRLLKAQVSIVYAFAVIAKLNLAFLSGGVFAVLLRHGGPFALPQGWLRVEVLMPMALALVFAEAFFVVGFWSRRWAGRAFVVACGFHLATNLLLPRDWQLAGELTAFWLAMLAIYTLFTDVNSVWVRVSDYTRRPVRAL